MILVALLLGAVVISPVLIIKLKVRRLSAAGWAASALGMAAGQTWFITSVVRDQSTQTWLSIGIIIFSAALMVVLSVEKPQNDGSEKRDR